MKPYRKPFFGDPLFPFEMTHRKTRRENDELPEHLHDLHELVYVHGGTGTILINQTLYEKRAGDLFIVPGNTVHRSFTDPADPIVSTAVFFAPGLIRSDPYDGDYAPLACFETARRLHAYKLALPGELSKQVVAVMDRMHEEWCGGKAGHRHAIRLLLQQLLLLLNRHLFSLRATETDRASAGQGAAVGPAWLQEALRQIDAGPEHGFRLSELARQASVSPAHFSRVFKWMTGMNVTHYVNVKRVMRAKELLSATDETIARIAERCGFETIPHFYRTFRTVTGTTPARYRRETRESGV
jgi:AraC-like DNA-binding protein